MNEQIIKDIIRKHLKEIAYEVQTLLQIHMHDYANVFADKHEDVLFQSIKPTLELKNILLEEYIKSDKEEPKGMCKFARVLGQIRCARKEILGDMAKRLNMTPAQLSAIQDGRTEMPDNFIERVAFEYSLSKKEIERLRKAKEDNNA